HLPVIGIGFQSPKVFRAVEARTQPEALSVGLAEDYVCRSLPTSSAVQAQGAAGVQLQGEAERATMCTDHESLTDLGELGMRLEASDADGDVDRDSRTAAYVVTVESGHSDPWLMMRLGQRGALRASASKYREVADMTSLRSAASKTFGRVPDCPFVRTGMYFGLYSFVQLE